VSSQGKTRLSLNISKVAFSGASAGANIAAVIAQKAAKRKLPGVTLRSQVLVVPPTDNTATPSSSPESSWKRMEYTAHLPAKKMLWYRRHYLPNQADWSHPEASPLLASDEVFRQLPPACIIVAELDCLRSDGEEYARRLEENGVKTVLTVMGGVPHPFLAMDAVLEAGKTGITEMCEALIGAFA
jgi:acetyl esterase/lipase